MVDSIILVGADDVRSAGSRMSSAADEMNRAATNIEGALIRHQQFLDDWLCRLEVALAAPQAGKVLPGTPVLTDHEWSMLKKFEASPFYFHERENAINCSISLRVLVHEGLAHAPGEDGMASITMLGRAVLAARDNKRAIP